VHELDQLSTASERTVQLNGAEVQVSSLCSGGSVLGAIVRTNMWVRAKGHDRNCMQCRPRPQTAGAGHLKFGLGSLVSARLAK